MVSVRPHPALYPAAGLIMSQASNLTPKYLTLLAYIRGGVNSLRDLNVAIGNKPGNGIIDWYLTRLKQWELVTWEPGLARTLKLTEAGQEAVAGLLLTRCGERVTGIWQVSPAATAYCAAQLIEKEPVFCTADEYEEMVS